MVTSQEMSENEMGYRGSKSEIQSPQPKVISVKEQRVDGSYFGFYPKLRCTLMGFERNYQFKIPSNQFNNRTFSTLNTKAEAEINPWFLTGFADAESCFSIKIQHNAKLKTKWRVRPVLSITLHIKDLALLDSIKNKFCVGNISKSGEKAVTYAVDSIKEIPVIINHFDKYPLLTNKLSDYLVFKQCFEIIKQGNHLTEIGLLEIVSLKSNLNLGLPVKVKEAFPNVPEVNKLEYKFNGIPNPFWIAGFTSGEGSFHILPRNSNIAKQELFARFSIHLHIRDLEVLQGISTYFKEDLSEKKLSLTDKSAQLQISKFSVINNIIIPFFNKHPLLGMKRLDFIDFCKVCDILKTKEHLTSKTVYNQIIEIKSGMNLNRK
uniref:LAGLIDADG homing endonuclease n=1 Tax=Blastosporella zonata TaxID=530045 RepID=A0A386TY00_9AGAR|nr:LAGLIDADG homing endonuclease [Blastosporella zonata]YP_009517205.1 LAGLIDADG homing endonuclease [Blastosporella zonata]AYE93092.1 LAGLIDADG homing endonuclease [Blastosporella zonata]AYE93093.1 LAGLIDADG homing endonuclease [Blastosporella zonata]